VDVRALVVGWPEDAPRGAVTRFCREHEDAIGESRTAGEPLPPSQAALTSASCE
jgi:hypothetical protein